MVRYSGFLSNRKRGTLLPKVYKALEMTARKKPENPGFAVLMKGFLRTDPYKCILCGDRLLFTGAQMGKKATELLSERLHNMKKNDGYTAKRRVNVSKIRLSDEKIHYLMKIRPIIDPINSMLRLLAIMDGVYFLPSVRFNFLTMDPLK